MTTSADIVSSALTADTGLLRPTWATQAPRESALASFERLESKVVADTFAGTTTLSDVTVFALRDRISNDMEAIALIQLEQSAADELASMLTSFRDAISALPEIATGTQAYEDQLSTIDAFETSISAFIGANIKSVGQLSYAVAEQSGATSDAAPVTVIDYMNVLNVSDDTGRYLGDVGVLEVSMNDVMNAYHQASTCPICQSQANAPSDASLDAPQAYAAPTTPDATTQAVAYTSGVAIGSTPVDALTGTATWDTTTSASIGYSYYDGGINSPAYDPSTYDNPLNDLAWNEGASSILSKATELDVVFQTLGQASALNFDKVDETATQVGEIRVAYSTTMPTTTFGGSAAAFAYMPNTSPLGGDIWMGDPSVVAPNGDFSVGSYGYYTMMHELGHAVGLSHPFIEGNGSPSSTTGVTLSADVENRRYTMMSYNQNKAYDRSALLTGVTYISGGGATWSYGSVNPSTPMLYDVAALESFYGVSTTTNTGNTTYSFTDSQAMLQNIVDSGGLDTIDGSNQTNRSIINLNAGSFSSIGLTSVDALAQQQASLLANAYEAENGALSDAARLSLTAQYKTALVNSMGSLDTAALTVYQTSGNDAMYLGQDNLSISYSATIENAIGGAGDDDLIGNNSNNALKGGLGDDTISGGAGIDTAIFSGSYADYTITRHSDGSLTVQDNRATVDNEGTDTLSGIESLEFADLTYVVATGETTATTASALTTGEAASSVYLAAGIRPPHWNLAGIGLLTRAESNAAVSILDIALDSLNAQRSAMGAVMNRLEAAINNMTTTSTNLKSAQSRVQDTDYAVAMTQLVKHQLQQNIVLSFVLPAQRVSQQKVLALLQ